MYTSLSVAKQAVLAVGEELKSSGLPPEICPLVFVFTGTGNGTHTHLAGSDFNPP
jgi:alpha-aminoadipic semialdehyde synthase